MSISTQQAAELALLAIDAALSALEKAQQAGRVVAQAQAEGRAHLTDAEWATIQQTDDAPRERLVETIRNMS